MPVHVNNMPHGHHLIDASEQARSESADALNVGLVNNMPDGALVATERQLFDLLRAAAGSMSVRLRLYALPGVARSAWGREYVDRTYLDLDDLCSTPLDGLIVTGAEPQAEQLSGEPYWNDLVRVIDWAKDGTSSTIWSCLAVHAAVLHIDGIDRKPLAQKCIGIFEQMRMVDHPILEDMPAKLPMPHSRWNEIPESMLCAHGYQVLTSSPESGVDSFVKQLGNSLFVFLQGHPEYEALSLLGEYRRDVGRFLRGEYDDYPTLPRHYFPAPVQDILSAFRDRAVRDRRPELLERFPVADAAVGLESTWQPGAHQLYRNWLTLLSDRKSRG